jgi:hypothetical protein
MAIQKEFEKYADEKGFTCNFLIPLLGRLGFYVTYYHGTREYGRDLIFSEIDRFGNFIYHGLQAKFEDSIGQKASEDLIADFRQAFRHPFQHPVTGVREYISSFVIANAGSYGANTCENFHEDARSQNHSGNVRLLDGKALIDLDRRATAARVEQVAEIASGLFNELRFNRNLMGKMIPFMQECKDKKSATIPIDRLRLIAIAHYLERPVLNRVVDINVVNSYYEECETVNSFLNFILTKDWGPNSYEKVEIILGKLPTTIMLANALEASIAIALRTLGPLAAS